MEEEIKEAVLLHVVAIEIGVDQYGGAAEALAVVVVGVDGPVAEVASEVLVVEAVAVVEQAEAGKKLYI